ncbi:DUF485 domain-containing protein [Thalassolituus maritimus]|jgi:uncharacterized membrane protein (DUF485 family)|uniref:DUF485 domain-containing protein n=1 Tax=Thalassolituus maritimus TaxID=484498 RepID=A0ABP9ZV54_9GAMM|nr:DUF485 domain-containing protein [Pseudomonadota bacterium]MEC8525483.1 DUF485 domain-containing protein [Pseudomonadota bacterium]
MLPEPRYLRLQSHPDYERVKTGIRRYRTRVAVLLLACYFVFLIAFAFYPSALLQPISAQNPMPWLIPVAVFLILFQFLLTGIYVKQMNTVFDEELRRLDKDVGS